MSFKIPKEQLDICKKIKEFKSNNKDREKNKQSYLILEEQTMKLIFKSELTYASQIILIYLLSKLQFTYEHLYIYMPYKKLESETGIKKATALNNFRALEKDGFINFLSGTNRRENNEIKGTVIFENEYQTFDPKKNQENLIDMTPFFKKLFKVKK